MLVLSGLKTLLTVAGDSVIRTKDGSYCGNDLLQKRSLQVQDIAAAWLTLLRTISRAL